MFLNKTFYFVTIESLTHLSLRFKYFMRAGGGAVAFMHSILSYYILYFFITLCVSAILGLNQNLAYPMYTLFLGAILPGSTTFLNAFILYSKKWLGKLFGIEPS